EGAAVGRAGVARAARRSPQTGDAELSGRERRVQAEYRAFSRAARTGTPRRRYALHGLVCGLGHSVVAPEWAAGPGDWDGSGEPAAGGNRGSHRMLRQHPRAADTAAAQLVFDGLSDGSPAEDSRRLRAPGCPVRAGRGGTAA